MAKNLVLPHFERFKPVDSVNFCRTNDRIHKVDIISDILHAKIWHTPFRQFLNIKKHLYRSSKQMQTQFVILNFCAMVIPAGF